MNVVINDSTRSRKSTALHADIASLDRLSKNHKTLSGMGSPGREYDYIPRQGATLKAALGENREVLALKKCT